MNGNGRRIEMTNKEFETIKDNLCIEYHEELEDIAIEALERQIPRKPRRFPETRSSLKWNCGYCGEALVARQRYCSWCGHPIDWSDEDD